VDTWDAIRARRNVRDYEVRPIPHDDLERILEAGRRTPSSNNEQPWDLVVVTDRDQLRDLAGLWRHAGHVAGSAATIGLVAPLADDEGGRSAIHYDLGQVTMSMILAAADLGIGSSHAAVGDQNLARELLRLPEDRELASMVAFGYPADRPLEPIEHPDRRPFDEVVHRDRW
jgi:nitroreductase